VGPPGCSTMGTGGKGKARGQGMWHVAATMAVDGAGASFAGGWAVSDPGSARLLHRRGGGGGPSN
jgi:hypothetical protein